MTGGEKPGVADYMSVSDDEAIELFGDLNTDDMLLNFKLAQTLGKEGIIQRSHMPVLETIDIEDLRSLDQNERIKVCEVDRLRAMYMRPLQSNIYLDKCIPHLRMLYSSRNDERLAAINYPPVFLTSDYKIIDGHHRWLTSMIDNPNMTMNAVVLSSNKLDEIFALTCKLTKSKGRIPND